MDKKILCYSCHAEILPQIALNISRSTHCPKCDNALKCCRMCLFYNQSSYNECEEPIAEKITDKEKANFCDYFKISNPASLKEKFDKNSQLEKLKSLFKDS
jgi:hypothetical protein